MKFLMSKKSSNKIYSLIYRRLHWILAGIIIALLIFGQNFHREISDSYRIWGLKAHSTLGTMALVVGCVFIFRRFVLRRPTPDHKLPLFKLLMARAVQLGLYSMAIFVPVSGMICAIYHHYPVGFLGFIDISAFVPDNEESYLFFRQAHVWATRLTMLMLAGHAGAALWHHFVVKDGVLKSMLANDPLVDKLLQKFKLRKI